MSKNKLIKKRNEGNHEPKSVPQQYRGALLAFPEWHKGRKDESIDSSTRKPVSPFNITGHNGGTHKVPRRNNKGRYR